MSVDVVTLAVIRGALDAIASEMDNTLVTAAFSTSIAEGRDLANGIYHAETGEVIAQGMESMPSFAGTMQFALQAALKEIDTDNLSPGDIFVANNIYWGGTHLMDVRLFKPFFYENKIRAWISNTGHWQDIGGSESRWFQPGCQRDYSGRTDNTPG